MHRNLPDVPAVQGQPAGHLQPASPAAAACYQEGEARARRAEAEALGTGLDDAGQPPATIPLDEPFDAGPVDVGSLPDTSSGATSRATKVCTTHPSVVEAQQARLERRQIQMRDHGNGPQYNPHRDDRRPAAHQADSGNDWHQAS